MARRTKHASILSFPDGISLAGACIEGWVAAMLGPRRHYLLDLQAWTPSQGVIFWEKGRLLARLNGHYTSCRLRFDAVHPIQGHDFLAALANLPAIHPARIVRGGLYWRAPGKTVPYVLLWTGTDKGGSHLFAARKCTRESRSGVRTAVTQTWNWLPPPPVPSGLVPAPAKLHLRFGGDPITIHLGRRCYHQRLFIGGLDIQPPERPQVDVVLNVGEESSRWVRDNAIHSADRWVEKGEGKRGMNIAEIIHEAQWVVDHMRRGRKVLVHCVAGFNRSATICTAVLMLLEGLSPNTALARVRTHHPWALPDGGHWLALNGLAMQRGFKIVIS